MRHAWLLIFTSLLSLPAAGAPLVIGTTEKWQDIVPFEQTPGEHHYAREFVAPPIVELNEQWEWVCRICTEIPSADKGTLKVEATKKNGKRMVTTWEIPAAMTWANGRPVTGYDVDYTFQHLKDGLANKVQRRIFPVEQVNVDPQNPRRFSVIFRQVRSDFAQVMAISLLPSYLKQVNAPAEEAAKEPEKEKGLEKDKEKPTKVTKDSHDITSPYFYYGPYQVKAHAGTRLELTRNPHYPKTSGNVDEIHILTLEKSAQALTQVLAGNIHMVADGTLGLDEAVRLKETLAKDSAASQRLKLVVKESLTLEHIVVNLRNPLLTDSNVRKALLLAIDRDKLNDQVFKGLATPADSLLNPNDRFYTKALREHAFSVEEAEKLLLEAGWVYEDGAKIRSKDGESLRLTLASTDDPLRRHIYDFVKQAWAKIGVEVAYDPQQRDYFQERTLRRVKFRDMALYSWAQAPGGIFWSTLHSRNIPAEENGYDGENTAGWFKNEVNHILDDLVVQFDPEEQKKLTATLMKHYVLDLPTLPLLFKPVVGVVPARMEGFVLPGHLYGSGLYAEKWKL